MDPVLNNHDPETGGRENKRRKKEASKSPKSIWFEWYSNQLWLQHDLPKQRFNDYKKMVGYMKLFLPSGFDFGPTTDEATFKQRVLAFGDEAEKNMNTYLARHNVSSSGNGSLVKILDNLRKEGSLYELVHQLHALIHNNKVKDITPQQLRFELTFAPITQSLC